MNNNGCDKCPRDTRCFYCGVVLSPRHEHDHWPVAKRHDGQSTVPICINCHDLKDRTPLSDWPVAMWVEAFAQCGPLGRLLIAKSMSTVADWRQELDRINAA